MFARKLFLLIVFCVSFHANIQADSLYFMPYENKQALASLIQSFKGAREHIAVAIYSFTNREIAKALRDAASSGVKIQIIYDKSSNLKNTTSTIGYLAKYKNISVCTLEGLSAKNYNGIMHQKMAIIDKSLLFIGSANWSKSAFEHNYETSLVSKNKEFIDKALKTFKIMHKNCKPY